MDSAAELEGRLEVRLRSKGGRLGSPDLLSRVFETAGRLGARRIADLGSGCGELLARLQADGKEATGLELCGSLLDRSRSRLPAGAPLVRGDAERLPWAAGRFDLVTSVLVLHYLRHPAWAVSEAARVLRPGGWIILADRIASAEPGVRQAQERIEHLRNPSVNRILSSQELDTSVRDAGFRIQEAQAIDEAIRLEEWLAGVELPRVHRIREELRRLPAADRGGMRFEAPDTLQLRIRKIVAQRA
jgi:SAM-dependent methyltransferase